MSHWNHRVVKQKLEDGSEWFSVREVFYNDDGSIYAYTENPIDISGESIEAMREYCQWVLNCLDKDVLIDGEVVFVDNDTAQQGVEPTFESIEDLLTDLDKGEGELPT